MNKITPQMNSVTNLKEQINFNPKNKRQEAEKMPFQFTKLLSN